MVTMHERIGVAANKFQGKYKRVLCVCSAGMLRSATAAVVLSQEPYNYNTRCAGVADYALIKVDHVLLAWADEIVCMEPWHERELKDMCEKYSIACSIRMLDIEDCYEYRDPVLIELIRGNY